jgi:hypothetical protein
VDARVTASAAAQHDQPVDASSCPSQLLTVKVLRRPVESAFAAAVGVEDRGLHPRPAAGGHRSLERITDQAGIVVGAHRPAQQVPGGQIQYRG